MDTKWVKDSFEKGKNELLKFAKISKIKLDINTLTKKKEERVKLLGNKVLEMIEKGELDKELFEPDYTYIQNIEHEIKEKEEELEETDEEETVVDIIDDDDIDIVQIESQKVLTADTIPVEPTEDTEEKEKKSE